MEEELSVEDFVGIALKPMSNMDYLAEVARVGLLKFNSKSDHIQSSNTIRATMKSKPTLDDVDMYYLGIIGYSENTTPNVSKTTNNGSLESSLLAYPLAIPKEKRSIKRKRTNNPVSVCRRFDDFDAEQQGEENRAKKQRMIQKIQKIKKVKAPRPDPVVMILPDQEPPLPIQFRIRIGKLNGSDAVLVVQKHLFKTDVGSIQGRLSIPENQIRTEFLTEEEKAYMDDRKDGDDVPEMKVMLIEPCCCGCPENENESGGDTNKKRDWTVVSLRKWTMSKKETGKINSVYNLLTTWKSVVSNNGLCEGMVVQLWAFRVDSKLCFALVRV